MCDISGVGCLRLLAFTSQWCCDLSSVPLSLVELSSRFANYSLTFLLKFLGLLWTQLAEGLGVLAGTQSHLLPAKTLGKLGRIRWQLDVPLNSNILRCWDWSLQLQTQFVVCYSNFIFIRPKNETTDSLLHDCSNVMIGSHPEMTSQTDYRSLIQISWWRHLNNEIAITTKISGRKWTKMDKKMQDWNALNLPGNLELKVRLKLFKLTVTFMKSSFALRDFENRQNKTNVNTPTFPTSSIEYPSTGNVSRATTSLKNQQQLVTTEEGRTTARLCEYYVHGKNIYNSDTHLSRR